MAYDYKQAFQSAMNNPTVGATSQMFQNNPQAFTSYLENNPQAMQQFGAMDFSKQAPGAFGTAAPQQDASAFGGMSMPSLEQFGAGIGIAKDLGGMYMDYRNLGLAKDQIANQKEAFNFNKTNKQNFINGTQKAFA